MVIKIGSTIKTHKNPNQKVTTTSIFTNRTHKKKKQKVAKQITGCQGTALNLRERQRSTLGLNPYSFACSLRCRHPLHISAVKSRTCSVVSTVDYIPEHIYKRYTETDSRPPTPDHHHTNANATNLSISNRRSASVPRTRSTERRKCCTPEPETKQCQFHERRVLILDLRRVKSVDAITRQNSLTTSFDDSTYADDDHDHDATADNRSHSSANLDSCSIFHQLSPDRNLSVSRSTTPKQATHRLLTTSGTGGRRGTKKKERSSSPAFYERSSSPKILEGLTLPPLHHSVLTLLGQRPGAIKGSPIGQLSGSSGIDPLGNSQSAPNSSRQKKLRRHRRKGKNKKGGENLERENEENENQNNTGQTSSSNKRGGSAASRSSHQQGGEGRKRDKEVVDDPHDTQMSAMSQTNDEYDGYEDDVEGISGLDNRGQGQTESMADLNAKRLQSYLEDSAKSLHQVLDEQLLGYGVEWNPSEMKFIDSKIKTLQDDFKKYETKFKAGNIRMKEDLWLSLPRTWSRASATFGIPTDLRTLSKMTPLEYVSEYIFISEPRKHLYSLVFNRYLVSTNPTGKTITYTHVQRALSEVLGRTMTDDESTRLAQKLLWIESQETEIGEAVFRGICALCERVFGKYNLEDCDECYTCLKYKGKDKTRCHKNQRDQVERVDFEFVASKIKDGRVQPQLAELLQAVFDRG